MMLSESHIHVGFFMGFGKYLEKLREDLSPNW